MTNIKKSIQTPKPADDLELYELIVAAYPDKFDENGPVDIWDDVMEFIDSNFGGFDNAAELIGRIVYLTNPSSSAITGDLFHCIGPVTISDGQCSMVAAITRKASA